MAWPPPALATTKTNTTIMLDDHPSTHNAANLAINDLVARFDAPSAQIAFSSGNAFAITGTAVNCPLQIVRSDNGGMHNPATGNLTCKRTGWYAISAHLNVNYNSVTPPTIVLVEVRIDAATDNMSNLRVRFPVTGASINEFDVAGLCYLTVNQTIALWVAQTGGSNVVSYATNATAQPTQMKAVWIA